MNDQGLMENLLERIKALQKQVDHLNRLENGKFYPLTTDLVSTSFDGDSFSTTAKTLIDLSASFGAPAGIKAVLINVAIRDSGSAANDCYLVLSPNNTAGLGPTVRCSGLPNDTFANGALMVPCDANGDIYYQVLASGANTLDVYLQIWGYWA